MTYISYHNQLVQPPDNFLKINELFKPVIDNLIIAVEIKRSHLIQIKKEQVFINELPTYKTYNS